MSAVAAAASEVGPELAGVAEGSLATAGVGGGTEAGEGVEGLLEVGAGVSGAVGQECSAGVFDNEGGVVDAVEGLESDAGVLEVTDGFLGVRVGGEQTATPGQLGPRPGRVATFDTMGRLGGEPLGVGAKVTRQRGFDGDGHQTCRPRPVLLSTCRIDSRPEGVPGGVRVAFQQVDPPHRRDAAQEDRSEFLPPEVGASLAGPRPLAPCDVQPRAHHESETVKRVVRRDLPGEYLDPLVQACPAPPMKSSRSRRDPQITTPS